MALVVRRKLKASSPELDTDKDGAISKSEVSADKRLAEHFDQADADHDGKVNATELKAFFATMKPPERP
ncbi:hypothetical protein MMA231_02189 [Asticcacaulis sp. MM231]|uniref:hypothetical protein n=1 Tax=Asticcacaulis sp. MM231 TaxID=3157666 RepID=UPI0032D57492